MANGTHLDVRRFDFVRDKSSGERYRVVHVANARAMKNGHGSDPQMTVYMINLAAGRLHHVEERDFSDRFEVVTYRTGGASNDPPAGH